MQSSFSDLEYAAKKKQTRRRFLSEIEEVTPWPSLLNVIAPQCFGFSDEGTEDAVYESQAIRRFVLALT